MKEWRAWINISTKKKKSSDVEFWTHPSSHRSLRKNFKKRNGRFGFYLQIFRQDLTPHPPQTLHRPQNPGRSAVLANENPRTEQLLLISHCWNYFPAISPFLSSPAWLWLLPGVVTPSAWFASEVSQTRLRYPHPRTKMYFSTIFWTLELRLWQQFPLEISIFQGFL